jgi:signal transduction histidine kinase
MNDSAEEIARDVRSVSNIEAVPTLLRVLCETTGMGFAAVARVTAGTWTACAVRDEIAFGLAPGGQLDVHTTLCKEVREARTPVVIDHASRDPVYCDHHTPRTYQIESYISVPIVLVGGDYFGNLCAIDPRPAKLSEPRIVSMFNLFAQLIALHLDNERKREETLADLDRERNLGELREQFIAILGHDLRTPLAAVSSCGQLLELKTEDPELSDLGASIRRSVRRMSALIGDVLDFARARLGGGIGLDVGAVADLDLDEALTAVVKELQEGHPHRIILCELDLSGGSGTFRCDRARIQQLASNLLSNALAYGAPESPVRLTALAGPDELVLEVWNDGNPIPEDSLPFLFEPFRRPSSSGQGEGLGLGLHICAQIVAAHGGTLQVVSTAEHGTRFTARLPCN